MVLTPALLSLASPNNSYNLLIPLSLPDSCLSPEPTFMKPPMIAPIQFISTPPANLL